MRGRITQCLNAILVWIRKGCLLRDYFCWWWLGSQLCIAAPIMQIGEIAATRTTLIQHIKKTFHMSSSLYGYLAWSILYHFMLSCPFGWSETLISACLFLYPWTLYLFYCSCKCLAPVRLTKCMRHFLLRHQPVSQWEESFIQPDTERNYARWGNFPTKVQTEKMVEYAEERKVLQGN